MTKPSLSENQIPLSGRSVSRVINQTAIAERIYNSGGISKAQLAKELGISKPAVSSNVASLISIGLVRELGEGEAAKNGGRRPVILRINEAYCFIGAIDLSRREPVCALCDLKYKTLGMKKIQTDRNNLPDEKKRQVWQAFEGIFREKQLPPEKLGIIIILQPGIISNEEGERYSENRHHAWTKIGLQPYLAEVSKAPVIIRNDVNTATIGEMHFGQKRRLSDLIYVTCGIGLGAGIVINGRLYEGVSYAAGEIGALLLEDGRRAEDVIAMDGLIRRIRQLYSERGVDTELTFPQILELAKTNDPTVSEAIYETGLILGRLLYNCSVMLDIKTVIIGGEYLELGKRLFDGIEDSLPENPIFHPRVFSSDLLQGAGLYGGFVIGKEKIIQSLIES